MLKKSKLREAINGDNEFENDQLYIIPQTAEFGDEEEGEASIDLRLGRWFLVLRRTHHTRFEFEGLENLDERELTMQHFVPFGEEFILHPGSFVLGATLEWVRLPQSTAGTIVGRSSWGRRGLVIETASMVHPGFSGCLTFELANVGEMAIPLVPGMKISQLIVQWAYGSGGTSGSFSGSRTPRVTLPELDPVARKLKEGSRSG